MKEEKEKTTKNSSQKSNGSVKKKTTNNVNVKKKNQSVNNKKKTTSTKKNSNVKKTNSVKNKEVQSKVISTKMDEVKSNDKKKITKKILDIINYILIVVVIVCLILLYFKREEDEKTINEIKETVVPKNEEVVKEKTVRNYIIDLQTKFNNNDIKGILNVSGLDVSIPIVKGKDNSYYLKHAVNKNKSVIGSVFMDYRNNTNSRQINIYGHNSTRFNPPFKVLEEYLEKEYYEKNKYIEFLVNDETRKYEIFSVIIADKEDTEEHMQFNYSNDNDWLKHFERLKKKSKYKINVNVRKTDNIIVLQTCIFGKYHNKLLVIVGREI